MSGQNLMKKFYKNVVTVPIAASDLDTYMKDSSETNIFTVKIDGRQLKTPDRNT